jgi:hypothetical protein
MRIRPSLNCVTSVHLSVLFVQVRDSEEALITSLSSEEQDSYRTAMGHLADLCAHAKGAGVALLFDAEQTHRQPAIDLISLQLMRTFNKTTTDGGNNEGGQAGVAIYNTFQMYLKDSLVRLTAEMDKAALEEESVVYGVKMVRRGGPGNCSWCVSTAKINAHFHCRYAVHT